MDSDGFFDQGGSPEIVAGRYRLPHPETGKEQSWTRATTHAELPEDSFALTRWQLRQLLLGLRMRPDLLRLIESWPDEPGRDELDQVVAAAHEVAGNDAKANLGTAVHGVLQRVDRAWYKEIGGPDPEQLGDVPEWARPHVRSYVAELNRHGLSPIPSMTERRVVNTDLGCAGTIDNLYEEADGAIALGDKKTGRLDYPERKYAIQLAVYHGSAYLLDLDGGPPIDLRSLGLRREYAVLVYVDPLSGACSVYRVDMRRGQLGANLATQVREWRRERHLLLPYVAPGGVPAEAWRVAKGERHLRSVPVDFTAHPDGSITDRVTGHRSPTPRQHVNTSGMVPGDNGPDPGTTAVSGGLADQPETTVEPPGAAELMKMSKSELQAVLRGLDPGASVAHQRKVLVDKILTVRSGGTVASRTPSDQTAFSTARQPTASKDPAEIAGPIGATEDPTDPHTQAFHRARMAEISAAPSVADLGRIHAGVVRVGGDQAWTDAMTEAARERAAELDARTQRHIEWGGQPRRPEEAVDLATSSQDMAQVWNLVTIGGSDESAWTPALNELAHARLAAIQAAAEQKSPSTPFGSVR